MSRTVIVGTGGMGRETSAWLGTSQQSRELLGFLDDDPARRGEHVAGLPILGGLSWLTEHQDVEVAVAVGNPRRRADLVRRLLERGIDLATVVHHTATIGPRVRIGPGVIVCPQVVLTCDITLGRAAIINYGAMLGHDGRVGDCAFVAPGAHLAGNVTVGEEADVGIGASVIQGVNIGAGSTVGAGAVVIRDVDPGTTVAGVPARPLVRG